MQQKTQSYDICILRYGVLAQTKIFLISGIFFCSFAPLLTPKIKIWKECKKITPRYIILLHMWQNVCQNFTCVKWYPGDIILHKCTKNDEHILYCSWDIARVRCNCFFFHFGQFLALLSPLTAQKMKISKN